MYLNTNKKNWSCQGDHLTKLFELAIQKSLFFITFCSPYILLLLRHYQTSWTTKVAKVTYCAWIPMCVNCASKKKLNKCIYTYNIIYICSIYSGSQHAGCLIPTDMLLWYNLSYLFHPAWKLIEVAFSFISFAIKNFMLTSILFVYTFYLLP